MTREVDHYELIIDVRGEHYADRITVPSESLSELDPEFILRGCLLFERYMEDDGCWTEIRADHVVARRLRVVHREPSERTRVVDPLGALDRSTTDYSLQHDQDQDEER